MTMTSIGFTNKRGCLLHRRVFHHFHLF